MQIARYSTVVLLALSMLFAGIYLLPHASGFAVLAIGLLGITGLMWRTPQTETARKRWSTAATCFFLFNIVCLGLLMLEAHRVIGPLMIALVAQAVAVLVSAWSAWSTRADHPQ